MTAGNQTNSSWSERIPPIKLLTYIRRQLKIGPKLIIGFSLLISLMLVGFGLGFFASNSATVEINRTTTFRAPLTLEASQAQANWLRLVADVQAYLALGDPEYKIHYGVIKGYFEANLDEIDNIIQQQGGEQNEYIELKKKLDELRLQYEEWSALVPRLFALRDDQLKREPALRILIVDATPQINTIIVNSSTMIETQKIRESTDANISAMGAMAEFQSSFYAMVAGLRGYVTTNRDSFKFEYKANLRANNQAWSKLEKIQSTLNQSQLEYFNKIKSARVAFLIYPDQMFEAAEGEHAREDLFLFRTQGVELSDQIQKLLDQEATIQQNRLQSDLNNGKGQLSNAQKTSLIGSLVILLAGLILAWAIGQDIARPIVRLTEVAENIKAGDLNARSGINSHDEIGILSDTFNSMTSNLQNTLESLRIEQEKSENLLLNILPKDIAELLKNEPHTVADHYSDASILFADVVNFTPMSSHMEPIELVELLNKVFSQFDDLVEKYDLEKIKTIGDCYMVASGVPKARPDHAQIITQLSLEMQDIVKQSDYFGRKLTFRIGINSGPVVAGVIGRKKFIYDLWGDAVNTASRMESNGAGGLVQVTQDTYELIKDDFKCESRGVINVKGKGELPVWFVHEKK